MVKWIIVGILLLPVAEIALFLLIAAAIGLSWTLALMLATTTAGFLVLRRAGRGRIARFRVAVADTDVTAIEANTGGFLTVSAGLLLFLPGFLTDVIGAALLIGPVRRRCHDAFQLWVGRRDRDERSVIDLAPGEWEQVPEHEPRSKPSTGDRD